MSDFLLDFRKPETRRQAVPTAVAGLKFCEDTQVRTLDSDGFSLVITRADSMDLWGPYEGESGKGKVTVALVGRIALDECQWDAAREAEGPGGLACKAIFQLYRDGGVSALEALNGNFIVFVHDARAERFYIITDRCGMCLVYAKEGWENSLVFCSHPDVLASVVGASQDLDPVSLAEFLMTTRLTFPFTYYQKIRGVDPGNIHTIRLQNGSATFESSRPYARLDFKIDPNATEWELAEELAGAFKRAVSRRTLPHLGTAGVALSGGLDSRVLLAAAGSHKNIRAFTLFDEENTEFKVARSIANACGVEMIPIKREFEYYGNSAELGVKISGGTGPLSCNHFLGARERLRDLGIQSILTGCYCDYLLKGLSLNTREGSISRRQMLGGFRIAFYDSITWFDTPSRDAVMSRLKALFPEKENDGLSEQEWLNVERKRAFPLAYEEDLAQRVIPQKVMPWYLPIVDSEILAVYLRIPPRFKLNSSLFRKMLTLLCPEKLRRIPDNNTGAPVDASWPRQTMHIYYSSLRNRISGRVADRMATRGSWPNWLYYLRNSKLMESLWSRPNPLARETFIRILGKDPFERTIAAHAEENLALCFNLLTQKLWLDQRN